jgi:hypothetical protein
MFGEVSTEVKAMQAYKTEARVDEAGQLHLSALPFRSGEEVEVIVLRREPRRPADKRYPLRGLPIRYEQPTEPVAKDDWEALG